MDLVTDGSCGLSWDDSISTSMTPAPSGRCPFEYFHKYDPNGEPLHLRREDIPNTFPVVPVSEAPDAGKAIETVWETYQVKVVGTLTVSKAADLRSAEVLAQVLLDGLGLPFDYTMEIEVAPDA